MSKLEMLTDDRFAAQTSGPGLVMVDFYADWCGPCKALAPTVEALAKQYAGQVNFLKMDVEQNPETAAQLGIVSIPTLVLFANGQEVDRLQGLQPAAEIQARIDVCLASCSAS